MFQANYKDTQITLTEAVPVLFFALTFEHVFVCWGNFRRNHSEEL